MECKKLFFKECHLAGAKYYDLDEVFQYLRVGTELKLVHDKGNPHDENAVAVMYTKIGIEGEQEDFHIGYLPQAQNFEVSSLLQMGWGNVFKCTIVRIDPEAYYENQIRLKISIRKNVESVAHA